jgi:hypothetical protein
MNYLTEHATSPSMAVPIGSATVVAGFVGSLPILINIVVAIYFVLMVAHKAYQMRKEWKADKEKEACKVPQDASSK